MKGWVWVTRQRHEVMGHAAETRFLPLLSHMKVKEKKVKSLLCPTLCDPMDCSLPGFSIHGTFQARILEYSRQEYWSAISLSRRSSQPRD